MLSGEICGGSPSNYLKRSPLVASFPEEFHRVESGKLRLEDGSAFIDKKSSNGFEVICTSFGLVSTFLRRKLVATEYFPVAFPRLKDFLNELDLNVISTGFVEDVSERPITARRLEMPPRSFSTPKTKATTTSLVTPPNSGGSPNLKEISGNTDLDTPEKIKKRGSRVMKNGQELCEQSRKNLSLVLPW